MNEEQKRLLKSIEAITDAYEGCELELMGARTIEERVIFMIDEKVLEYLKETEERADKAGSVAEEVWQEWEAIQEAV